jgi:hypothetical protein
MEPEWTKSIPSWAVCNWFYAFFFVNIVVFIAAVAGTLLLLGVKGMPKAIIVSKMITYVLLGVMGATNALFYYIICDRALNP